MEVQRGPPVGSLGGHGCTNAEIAERRFVSVQHRQDHLSRIYAKVGVAGRAELAAEAARRDG